MKNKTCDSCGIPAEVLIRSRTVTGQEINRCEPCTDRMAVMRRGNNATLDLKTFRPKFLQNKL